MGNTSYVCNAVLAIILGTKSCMYFMVWPLGSFYETFLSHLSFSWQRKMEGGWNVDMEIDATPTSIKYM